MPPIPPVGHASFSSRLCQFTTYGFDKTTASFFTVYENGKKICEIKVPYDWDDKGALLACACPEQTDGKPKQ